MPLLNLVCRTQAWVKSLWQAELARLASSRQFPHWTLLCVTQKPSSSMNRLAAWTTRKFLLSAWTFRLVRNAGAELKALKPLRLSAHIDVQNSVKNTAC
ncbi:UNVERIFIED_CONTAM: hypothetical protein GTU68_015643 [Idotea baltica]|nr:hypothetical protein [Idotea baltica]